MAAGALERVRGVIVRLLWRRSVPLDVVQGLLVGYALSLLLTYLLIGAQTRAMMTTVNGWQTTQACGVPGTWLVEAACARTLPAVNAPAEAIYWQARVDADGERLTGARAYVLHFPPGGFPPVTAFWSLTLGGPDRLMTRNAAHRYSVSDRSGLQPNPDGSVDVLLQASAPTGREANWLPTPSGAFMLWLRAYEPGPAVLDGTYRPPAVVERRP